MKLLASTLALSFLVLSNSCQKSKIDKDTPDCVKDKIRAYDEQNTCDDGVKVDCYVFQNELVYVFEPGTCGADMTSEVIDSDCNTLGYLGGIMGNHTINGENFDNATFSETVWEK
jgi:hypothetical protein